MFYDSIDKVRILKQKFQEIDQKFCSESSAHAHDTTDGHVQTESSSSQEKKFNLLKKKSRICWSYRYFSAKLRYTVLQLLNINFILERSSQNVLNRHSYEISKIKKDLTRNRLNPIIDEWTNLLLELHLNYFISKKVFPVSHKNDFKNKIWEKAQRFIQEIPYERRIGTCQ